MKRAVIYARFSSHNQREESIEGQLRVCTDYADKNGIDIVDTYCDFAISGRTDNRPAFQKMISDSEAGLFDMVLIYAVDRFSRNREVALSYKRILKANGVDLISVTQPNIAGPEGILMESLLDGFAEYYSANLSKNVKRGMEENALKGKSNGATPYGYRVENGYFVIDEKTAPAVRLIFEMFADGQTKTAIVSKLNQSGCRTRQGNAFKIYALDPILANERYTGVYIHGDHRIDGGMPQIISNELFQKVQEERKVRKTMQGRKRNAIIYPLSGKLFCGLCHEPMTAQAGTSSTGKVYQYYACNNSRYHHTCTMKNIRKDAVENEVLDLICSKVLTDENIALIAGAVDRAAEDYNKAQKLVIEGLQARLKECERKYDNLWSAILDGLKAKGAETKLAELESEKERLEREISEAKAKAPILGKEQVTYWLQSFRIGALDTNKARETIFNALVNEVILYEDRIEIALKLENAQTIQSERSRGSQMVTHMLNCANFWFSGKDLVFSAPYVR